MVPTTHSGKWFIQIVGLRFMERIRVAIATDSGKTSKSGLTWEVVKRKSVDMRHFIGDSCSHKGMKMAATLRSRPLYPAGTSRRSRSVIPYRTIAERVVDWMRHRIIARELIPGTVLREARLARELQTSRAPVREAISQLVQEGWATKRPNQSARLIVPNESMLREAATLRNVLERYAATLAIDRLDKAGCRLLANIVDSMQRAVAKGDFSRAFELDYAFHNAVMRAAGHQMLYEMWARMGMYVRLLISGTNTLDRDLRNTVHLHRRIVAAFRKRDVLMAQELMGTVPQDFEHLLARVAPRVATRFRAGKTSLWSDNDLRKGEGGLTRCRSG